MKAKSAFMALGVMTTLAIGGGVSAEAQSQPLEIIQPQVVTVQAGDTLGKIASANNTTYVRLFNANEHIAHPDRINAGDQVTVPAADAQLPDRLAQLAAPTATPVAYAAPVVASTPATPVAQTTAPQYTSAPVNSTSYYVGNGMWCTDYVHSKRPDVPIYGNAGYNWVGAAQAQGKATGSSPQAGAVAVMNGHVAYVESVNSDGSYVVSEMGWNYQPGNYNQRTVQPGAFGSFIY